MDLNNITNINLDVLNNSNQTNDDTISIENGDLNIKNGDLNINGGLNITGAVTTSDNITASGYLSANLLKGTLQQTITFKTASGNIVFDNSSSGSSTINLDALIVDKLTSVTSAPGFNYIRYANGLAQAWGYLTLTGSITSRTIISTYRFVNTYQYTYSASYNWGNGYFSTVTYPYGHSSTGVTRTGSFTSTVLYKNGSSYNIHHDLFIIGYYK